MTPNERRHRRQAWQLAFLCALAYGVLLWLALDAIDRPAGAETPTATDAAGGPGSWWTATDG